MSGNLKKRRGQALLEFALVVSILLLLVGGIIDVARIYFAYQIVSDAAREGAIYGTMDANNTNAITQRAVDSTSTLPLSNDDVSIHYSGGQCANGSNRISVTVSHTISLHMPITMSMFGDTFTVEATESATILAPPCP